jgi:transcriptional regulator with XRE-family HTH domain
MAKRGPKPKADIPPHRPWAPRLRTTREGLSPSVNQTEMAAKIGKSQSQVTDYESGKAEPSIATFIKWANIVRVSPAWLIFGDEYDRDAGVTLPKGDEENRLFAWTVHQAAKLLTEEGMDGDLTYLTLFSQKLMRSAEGVSDETKAKEIIWRTIETERAEFRQGKNNIRKNRI